MKFQVEFLREFSGLGSVYIDEMALVFEGRRPKFHVAVLNQFYHRVVDETAIVTVPYSRIIKVANSRDDWGSFYGIMLAFAGFIFVLIGDINAIAQIARYINSAAGTAAAVIWLIWSYIGGPYRSIRYRDIGGNEKTIVLRFVKPRKENASTFTARIEEFLAVTRPFAEDKRV